MGLTRPGKAIQAFQELQPLRLLMDPAAFAEDAFEVDGDLRANPVGGAANPLWSDFLRNIHRPGHGGTHRRVSERSARAYRTSIPGIRPPRASTVPEPTGIRLTPSNW